MRRRNKIGLWVLGIVAAFGSCLSLCIGPRWAEVHRIPAGFTGPVYVVCGVVGGEDLTEDETGALVHRIPPDGLLISSNRCRESGWYSATYLVEAPDGARRQIPANADAGVFQVFARVGGMTNYQSYAPIGEIRWDAYMVGVPDQLRDWPALMRSQEERAISRAMAMRAEAAAGRRGTDAR